MKIQKTNERGYRPINEFKKSDLVETHTGTHVVVGDGDNGVYGISLKHGSNITNHDCPVRLVEGELTISNE